MQPIPRWADIILVPLVSLLLAAICATLIILAIGQSPWEALTTMVTGALGSAYGWGYTLYYATSFIFTGLAVTIAFHAGLFNIGGEGQAQIGGLGIAMALLFVPWPHWTIAFAAAILASAAFGAVWGAIPGWLQAKRGSHIVITTIMFNYIAYALIVWVLVDILRPPGQAEPATARFGVGIPALSDVPGLNLIFTRRCRSTYRCSWRCWPVWGSGRCCGGRPWGMKSAPSASPNRRPAMPASALCGRS